jgi:3-isopropylmalate/(R)-2-methylmalate dehydratase small subunit
MFGDHINTDLIFPSWAYSRPPADHPALVFSALRPEWASSVGVGDVLVAGRNFGTGSARPIGRILRAVGVRAVIAETFNGLGFRNCINDGLPALAVPGISDRVEEGHVLRIDFATGELSNRTSGWQGRAAPLPPSLVAVLAAGGVVPMLVAAGLVRAERR